MPTIWGFTVSSNTVRLELALLSSMFSIACVEWGTCRTNPVEKVRKPRVSPGRDRRLTSSEERRLSRYFQARNAELYTIFHLALETAMRHEAISRLFELGTLNVMEVAAISGHKSLNMLKRYTHLRAYQLVSKLDVRRRQSQKIATYFVPYPAELEDTDDGFNICLPDFEGLSVSGRTREAAIDAASVMLLRRLAMAAQQGERVPRPGDLPVHTGVMIDPLPGMRQ